MQNYKAPPNPSRQNKILPVIFTYSSNYSNNGVVKQANILLQNRGNNEIKNTFKNTKVVLAHRQPPNILRRLSKARFKSSDSDHLPNGLYSSKQKICKICKLYLKECTSFRTANDFEWIIKCHISCNSCNVILLEMSSVPRKDDVHR